MGPIIVKEKYEVEIQRDDQTGAILQEVWTMNGRTSREGGPALIRRNAAGIIVEEVWMLDGLLHRTGGERASFGIDDKGVVFYENWAENGRYHRDGDLPADIMRSTRDGQASVECWYQHGLRHRENGKPAVIHYSENGVIELAEFYEHDEACSPTQNHEAPIETNGAQSALINYDTVGRPTSLPKEPGPRGP